MRDWKRMTAAALAQIMVSAGLLAADQTTVQVAAPEKAGQGAAAVASAKPANSSKPVPEKAGAKAAEPAGLAAGQPGVPPAAAANALAVSLVNASLTPQSGDQQDGETMEAVSARVDTARRKITDLEGKINKKAKQIQALLESYDKAEKNLTGFNGLGRIEQMELKAELYAGERMARKKIGEEFSTLNSLIEDWDSSKRGLKEDLMLLALKKQIVDLKNVAEDKSFASVAPGTADPVKKLMDIEYYQVKKDADLRTISAYPDVYGTPDFWEFLYKANKDKIPDPLKPVPAGTTLVVPQDVKRLPDFSDL